MKVQFILQRNELFRMFRWPKMGFRIALLFLTLSSCGGGDGGSSSPPSGNLPESQTSSITLSWETPVSESDGKPLANLAGFNIYYGKSSLEYSEVIDAGNVRTLTLQNLPGGTYYLAITAYDSEGNETNLSPEINKTIP
ncbi:MAG: fibronectin type III domain-containing protein [Syntrophaceae bacterium]|nr:fibronectin type III domain-containing protein [Syntrophaceae bacterium]